MKLQRSVFDECAAGPQGRVACVLQSPIFAAILIAAVTLAVFIHVLSADFVMWDDDVAIYKNPAIRSLDLARIFTDVDSMMRYNPLTLLGWSITYHYFKLNPFWYHLVNWLMHGLNAGLVFLLLRRLLVLISLKYNWQNLNPRRITISAGLAALLWSLHPMRVEPVAWCTDRTYCQSLLFLLLSLLFYLKANDQTTAIGRHYILLSASVVLYIVSLLSHAIVITFFPLLLVLDLYLLGKFSDGGGWWKYSANSRALLEKIPFAVAALGIALITVCVRVASAGVWVKPVTLAQFGIFNRFMQAMYIWAHYIWRPWYPFDLAPVYTTLVWFKPLPPAVLIGAILVVGLIALMILARHRWPLVSALIICHLVLLVPVLGVFEYPHYPCDRYSLIVSILWSVLLAAWLIYPKIKTFQLRISLVLSVIVIAGLAVLTFRQTYAWTNSKTLFTHTIKTLGNDRYASDIYWRLGNVYQLEGNTEEAMRQFEQSLRISPNFVPAQKDYCLTLYKQKKFDEAVACFEELLERNGKSAELLCKVAWILATRAQVTAEDANKSIGYAEEACKITGYKDATALDTLAVAYASAGRFVDAINSDNQALIIAKANGRVEMVIGILGRMELYRAGQPYREK